jgi:hyperosmotically inducible protein
VIRALSFQLLSNLHHTVIRKCWNTKHLKAVNLCNKKNREVKSCVQFSREEYKKMKSRFVKISLALALAALTVPMFGKTIDPKGDLPDAVRHQLVMLPYYSVFDDLQFSVDNGVVTLAGDVTRPVLKSDAGNVVKNIAGVTSVVNNIKVLPLSPFDNRIRAATYRSVFGYAGLYRYAMGANPSIHIIVDNGHVTLKGVVSNQGDKNIAYIRANGVPGVFSVTNDLVVAGNS